MDSNGAGRRVAFVLGGGGILGAHEVGMLRALAEAGVAPDLILGTSIGAVNGALFAADPTIHGVERLSQLWSKSTISELGPAGILRRVGTLARTGTHLESLETARARLGEALPVERIEDLPIPFQCVAASIERAAEHWFDHGPLADVVLASCAVPGILPPVRVGDEHFIDGGIVNSIPVARAVRLGATSIYVLQVGRLETPLQPPRWPWEVGLVAFEVARRHRFAYDLQSLPGGGDLHAPPRGGPAAPAYSDVAGQLGLRRPARNVARWVDSAYEASARY